MELLIKKHLYNKNINMESEHVEAKYCVGHDTVVERDALND